MPNAVPRRQFIREAILKAVGISTVISTVESGGAVLIGAGSPQSKDWPDLTPGGFSGRNQKTGTFMWGKNARVVLGNDDQFYGPATDIMLDILGASDRTVTQSSHILRGLWDDSIAGANGLSFVGAEFGGNVNVNGKTGLFSEGLIVSPSLTFGGLGGSVSRMTGLRFGGSHDAGTVDEVRILDLSTIPTGDKVSVIDTSGDLPASGETVILNNGILADATWLIKSIGGRSRLGKARFGGIAGESPTDALESAGPSRLEQFTRVPDFNPASVPTPPAGTRNLFTDNSTGKLSVKKSDASIVSLEEQPGGGGGAVGTWTEIGANETEQTATVGTLQRDVSIPTNTYTKVIMMMDWGVDGGANSVFSVALQLELPAGTVIRAKNIAGAATGAGDIFQYQGIITKSAVQQTPAIARFKVQLSSGTGTIYQTNCRVIGVV